MDISFIMQTPTDKSITQSNLTTLNQIPAWVDGGPYHDKAMSSGAVFQFLPGLKC